MTLHEAVSRIVRMMEARERILKEFEPTFLRLAGNPDEDDYDPAWEGL